MPETSVPGRLHFAVLGAFRVDRDGQAVPLRPRLQRTLLAILVVEAGHVVPVDRLVDLLWHEEPPGAAIASLQAYISQLRRVLGPGRSARAPFQVLVTQDPGYVLRVRDDDVDSMRFHVLARQAHLDLAADDPQAADMSIEAALALWGGEPLVEFAGEPWAVPVAARPTEAHDLVLEDRIDAWLELGRHTGLVRTGGHGGRPPAARAAVGPAHGRVLPVRQASRRAACLPAVPCRARGRARPRARP